MKSGNTQINVGEEIRVVHISSSDPDDKKLEGMTGKATHPFGDSPGTILGVFSKDGRFSLCKRDTIEIVETGEIIRL